MVTAPYTSVEIGSFHIGVFIISEGAWDYSVIDKVVIPWRSQENNKIIKYPYPNARVIRYPSPQSRLPR